MTLWPFQSVICFQSAHVSSFVAPRCSAAYLIHCLGIVGIIVFPILLTFASDNVWVKESVYREQPVVTFGHDVFIVLAGDNPADSIGWCSRQDLRALLPEHVLVPTIRAGYHDLNHDGIPDEIHLRVEMPFTSGSLGFKYLLLLAVYDYELRTKVSEQIGALVVIDVFAPYTATGMWMRGRLKLRQNMPLRAGTETRTVYASSPLEVDWSSYWAAQNTPLTTRALLSRYAARNETVYLEPIVPPVWDYTPSDHFTAELVMDVFPDLVHFKPRAGELLKFAWMQVLALGVPIYFSIRCILQFLFENQIVETYVISQVRSKGVM